MANYAQWLALYESHDSARVAKGLHNYVFERGIGTDSNRVMVALYMDDPASAKSFSEDTAAKAVMQKAGIMDIPKAAY